MAEKNNINVHIVMAFKAGVLVCESSACEKLQVFSATRWVGGRELHGGASLL